MFTQGLVSAWDLSIYLWPGCPSGDLMSTLGLGNLPVTDVHMAPENLLRPGINREPHIQLEPHGHLVCINLRTDVYLESSDFLGRDEQTHGALASTWGLMFR